MEEKKSSTGRHAAPLERPLPDLGELVAANPPTAAHVAPWSKPREWNDLHGRDERVRGGHKLKGYQGRHRAPAGLPRHAR